MLDSDKVDAVAQGEDTEMDRMTEVETDNEGFSAEIPQLKYQRHYFLSFDVDPLIPYTGWIVVMGRQDATTLKYCTYLSERIDGGH